MEINYEKIKKDLPIEIVLKEYGLIHDLKKSQYRLYGQCPIHKGDNLSAFHVDLEKNLWNCFTHCGGGSVIDLLMKIENVNVYQAGLLGEKLLQGVGAEKNTFVKEKPQTKNNPLGFRLNLNSDHPYLYERKIAKDTVRNFGIGYCSKGIMRNRIAIPIHDLENNLIAYCGRVIDSSLPKYYFPKGFKKSEIVYNLNRIIKSDKKELVIVEGFFDVFRLYQAGIDSVAIMGSSISQNQKQQLESLDKKLIIMFDGDMAGRKGMEKALDILKPNSNIRAIYLPNNLQPDDLKEEYLRGLIL